MLRSLGLRASATTRQIRRNPARATDWKQLAVSLTLVLSTANAAAGIVVDDQSVSFVGAGTGAQSSEINGPLPATTEGQSATYETAAAKLATLPVKGRAPKTGYSRDQFGQNWADADRNGCDTRNDVLRRDLTKLLYKPKTNGCVVASGTLADPYSGMKIEFERGPHSNRVQIDHVVALSDAWQKGAQQLGEKARENFANDPLNLIAVNGPTNQQKSDGDAATWLPPVREYRCQYVSRQVDVKAKYGLWVTQAEKNAIARVLEDCSGAIPAIKDVPKPIKSNGNTPDTAGLVEAGGTTGTSGASGASGAKDNKPKKDAEKPKKESGSGPKAPISKTECPGSAPIKGNQGSNGWIYHTPSSKSYSRTHPEQCFVTETDARDAGYRAPHN